MKLSITSGFLLLALAGTLSSCLKDSCDSVMTYTVYNPVYIKMDEVRNDIQTEAPRALKHPGKIYVFGRYLYVNEYHEGIHIIDNQDPENPQPVSFIKIPGNVDMVVNGNLLYADNYVDLVTMNVENPQSPQFVSRTQDVFPSYGLYAELGHLVYYEPSQVTQQVPCESPNWGRNFWLEDTGVLFVANNFDGAAPQNASAATGGFGGSMARFTLASNHLYVVDDYSLRVFSLTNETQPQLATTVNLGWGIETIFPYENKLFIGANDGMHIYDNSNPLQPQFMSIFQHARACDPVFVDGNLAYVTLRNGTTCQTFNNQLDVVDVSELTNPRLLKTYPMHNPHGLSVVDNTLLLCEGDQGLKAFDVSEWDKIGQRQLSHITGFNTFDVIGLPFNKVAIVTGKDGIYQFDFSNPSQLKQLSVMPVQ